MKKLLALAISLALIMSSIFVSFADSRNMGDIDNNGKIDVIDATSIQRYVAKIISLDDESMTFCDVDADGKVSVMDCTCIQQFVAKIITEFPCDKLTPTNPTENDDTSTNSSLKPAETQAETQVVTETETQVVTETETQPPVQDKEQILKEMELEILRLVNIEREKENLKPLEFADAFHECARLRAYECRTLEIFSHTRPNGQLWYSVFDEFDTPEYRVAGENIAIYFQTPQEVVTAWMNSDGHRANILYPDFTLLAVGLYETEEYPGYYSAAQLFVTPM